MKLTNCMMTPCLYPYAMDRKQKRSAKDNHVQQRAEGIKNTNLCLNKDHFL